MSQTVLIPTPLRKFTSGSESVSVEAQDVAGMLESLEAQHPGIKERICDESGALRRFVNVYVDGEDIRFLDNLKTPLKENSEISIVPAIAGGC